MFMLKVGVAYDVSKQKLPKAAIRFLKYIPYATTFNKKVVYISNITVMLWF